MADWAPSLAQVADHIGRFTVDTNTPGSAVMHGTFTTTTSPTDTQAGRIITQVVEALETQLGTVATEVQPMARWVAALRAAAVIARSFARSADDVAVADSLDRRADAEQSRLVAVDAATDGTPVDADPVFSFPPTTTWPEIRLWC